MEHTIEFENLIRDRLGQQIRGFFHAKSGFSLADLLSGAAAEKAEIRRLEDDGDLSFLSDAQFNELCVEMEIENSRMRA